MWRVTAGNGQFRCEGYRRGWFASLGFDFCRFRFCYGQGPFRYQVGQRGDDN